jgi:hypothetical protein
VATILGVDAIGPRSGEDPVTPRISGESIAACPAGE